MNPTTQKWCVWSGAGLMVLWLGGFIFFAHFVPPPSPNKSVEQIAAVFQDHRTATRFGLMLLMFGASLFAPWVVAISAQMKRIRGTHPMLADLQLALGTLLIVVFIVPVMLLQAAAFRPDRSADSIAVLYDAAWLSFVGIVSTGVLQAVVIAMAIFQDTSEDPVFPRWAGYFNVWVAILFVPGGLVPFFKTGPFAWDGLFAWWIPLVVFSLWIIVMMPLMHGAINREVQDQPSSRQIEDPRIRRYVESVVAEQMRGLRAEATHSGPVTSSPQAVTEHS